MRLEENLDSIRLNIPRKIYERTELSITNDSKFIIAPLIEQQCVEVWSIESKVLAFKREQTQPEVIAVCTSADSKFMFYTSDKNEITQLDLNMNQEIAVYKGNHKGDIVSLTVSPDGSRLISASNQGEMCFYITPTDFD